jgi:hypothetical protein
MKPRRHNRTLFVRLVRAATGSAHVRGIIGDGGTIRFFCSTKPPRPARETAPLARWRVDVSDVSMPHPERKNAPAFKW